MFEKQNNLPSQNLNVSNCPELGAVGTFIRFSMENMLCKYFLKLKLLLLLLLFWKFIMHFMGNSKFHD
jgi:hypothetical protein